VFIIAVLWTYIYKPILYSSVQLLAASMLIKSLSLFLWLQFRSIWSAVQCVVLGRR